MPDQVSVALRIMSSGEAGTESKHRARATWDVRVAASSAAYDPNSLP